MGTTLGFKDPNNKVCRPKYNNNSGIWALKPLVFRSLDPYNSPHISL